MNLHSIVAVMLRLMALDLLLHSTLELGPKIFQLLHLYRTSSPGGTSLEMVFPWLLLLGLAAAAILLWVFAPQIARFVTRGIPEQVSLGGLTLADCYSIAFIGFGLYYMGSSLPQVLTWFHYLFKTAASTSGDSWLEQLTYEVVGVFLRFGLGLVLFVKGRTWSVKLACRQTGGGSPNQPLQATAAPPNS